MQSLDKRPLWRDSRAAFGLRPKPLRRRMQFVESAVFQCPLASIGERGDFPYWSPYAFSPLPSSPPSVPSPRWYVLVLRCPHMGVCGVLGARIQATAYALHTQSLAAASLHCRALGRSLRWRTNDCHQHGGRLRSLQSHAPPTASTTATLALPPTGAATDETASVAPGMGARVDAGGAS